MADQPMSEVVPGVQPSPLGPQQPTGTPALADLIRAYGGQHNPQGMTSTGPDFTGYNITQPRPANVQPQQPVREFSTRGAANRADMQSIATSIGNTTSKIAQNIEQRKFRENKQVFDTYTKSLTGLQQAQGQLQQAQAEKNKAIMALSKNPMDQEAAAALGKATQDEQKAQQAMQLNKTNLSDLFNGPKGEKHAKMLQKGFGIDDKNQDTPERKAAIQSLQSSMGVDRTTASIASHQPQTMQLSPEAQQQQMAIQAGVSAKPNPTGDMKNALTARGQDMREQEQQAALLEKNGISSGYIQLRATKQGQVAEKGTDGQWSFRPMTPQEKALQGSISAGKIAWVMKDGKPLAVLRDPATNQIIPGSENPAILPPSYLTEHLREGNYFWTDADGNVHETPVSSSTKPNLPGGKHTVTPMTPKSSPTPGQNVAGVSGDKILGKGRPSYASMQLRMNFEKSYEKPAEDVEKSYQMSDYAYKEYHAAAAKGETLPSGAQSMLMLSTHLSTTFGGVKGARITKDLIKEHFGARGLTDDAVVAIQKLSTGDALSNAQWEAFHDLISQSRNEQWNIAAKEARRAKVPVDFIPMDLIKKGAGAPDGFKMGRDGAVLASDHKTIVGWKINGKFEAE